MITQAVLILSLFLSLASPFAPRSFITNIPSIVQVFDYQRENIAVASDQGTVEISDIDFGCVPNPSLKREIKSYQPIVDKIAHAVTKGEFKGKTYEELANFVDKFGSRLAGTKNLEDSLDYMINLLEQHGLDNVHGEPVTIPHWVRGNESAMMISPRHYKMSILGLGGSISTPPEGITAEVLVVNSFDELHEKAELAKGKIVVFNQKWVSYPVSVKYRSRGAVEAAKVGAVAALIRSVTPMSLYSPHTGWQDYDENVKKIPVASITVEDAQMFRRMSIRGEKIVVHLYMEAETKPEKLSRNIVADLTGTDEKEEIVLLSGHLDSWDVGQGALDDGAGAFTSWYSLVVLKCLGLLPKRTIRAVLWTAEEVGLVGAKEYVKAHADELDKFNLVMESDEGTFTPEGIEFAGANKAACIMKEIARLFKPLNATNFKVDKYVGSDITEFTKVGVPAADLINKNDKYFWYHHTNADTMTLLNSHDLDRNVAMFAAVSYIAADLSKNLPRVSVPDVSDVQRTDPDKSTSVESKVDILSEDLEDDNLFSENDIRVHESLDGENDEK